MTKFSDTRTEILGEFMHPPASDRALFEMIATRICKPWETINLPLSFNMHRIRILPVAVFALFASACGISPKAPPTHLLEKDNYSLVADYFKTYIPSRMQSDQITGLSVALVDDQNIVWSDGFGFADQSNRTKASKSTAYRAGSVFKLFTAMAIMKLAENQQLDIDAPIKASVPTFDLKTRFGSIDKITLRNILSHHAGIPTAIYDGMWSNEPDSFKTVTSKLNRYYAAYPTDTVFAYSNAGYSVAGHAVESSMVFLSECQPIKSILLINLST